MPRQLEWTTHAQLGQFTETPDHTTRKADGVPLKIEMGHIYGDLGDKPIAGCGSIYVYLSAFGESQKTKRNGTGFLYQSHDKEQGWNCFKSVQIYTRENDVSVCRFDPENGPLDTPEQRLAAVKRAYPVVVDLLKAYAAACFDGYDAPPETIVIDEDPVTTMETLLSGTTVIAVTDQGVTVPANRQGLNRREAAEFAIEQAKDFAKPVEMVFNGAWLKVHADDDLAAVIAHLPEPGNNWPAIRHPDSNDIGVLRAAADAARTLALREDTPVLLSFRDRIIVVLSTDALSQIEEKLPQ